MIEKEFNLIEEPWILVLDKSGVVKEVSILEVFQDSHNLVRLAGELATQDLSILRLLLAIMHSVYGRSNAIPGFSDPMISEEDALARWKKLWDLKYIPISNIETYLRIYADRFYLFHPKYPFYQVADLTKGTSYSGSKLNGELSESNNKLRLFPNRNGCEKNILNYSEAARWLLHVNNFDDTSSKPQGKNLPTPGVGWLGKLGNITAQGSNLFETILLNFVLLDSQNNPWEAGQPIWERPVQTQERREIITPSSQVELLTLQSRRLLLKRSGDVVTGFLLLGGDFFQKEDTLQEMFTVWQPNKKGKEIMGFKPRRHIPSKQLWRDFSNLLLAEQGQVRPGIVEWLSKLRTENIIENKIFKFSTSAVNYADKDFFADDIINDSISFSSTILDSMNNDWIVRIIKEIENTDSLINEYAKLASRINIAKGNRTGDADAEKAKEQAYFLIDPLFREWLKSINPEIDDKKIICDKWWKSAQTLIREMGKNLANESGITAFVGRMIDDDRGLKRPCNSAEAFNTFLYRTKSRETF